MYEAGCIKDDTVVLNKDNDAAIRYYKEAADKVSTLLTRSSDQGCIKSQLRLATLLICTPKPIQNYPLAVKYLLLAGDSDTLSEQSSALSPNSDAFFNEPVSNQSRERMDAQNLLGELIELGQVDEEQGPDPVTAALWYRRAMRQGHARATFNLGSIYENGSGVSRDMEKAIRLYEEADRRGSIEARERLEELQEMDMFQEN